MKILASAPVKRYDWYQGALLKSTYLLHFVSSRLHAIVGCPGKESAPHTLLCGLVPIFPETETTSVAHTGVYDVYEVGCVTGR